MVLVIIITFTWHILLDSWIILFYSRYIFDQHTQITIYYILNKKQVLIFNFHVFKNIILMKLTNYAEHTWLKYLKLGCMSAIVCIFYIHNYTCLLKWVLTYMFVQDTTLEQAALKHCVFSFVLLKPRNLRV